LLLLIKLLLPRSTPLVIHMLVLILTSISILEWSPWWVRCNHVWNRWMWHKLKSRYHPNPSMKMWCFVDTSYVNAPWTHNCWSSSINGCKKTSICTVELRGLALRQVKNIYGLVMYISGKRL
jgi:hypothetical protein